MHGLTGLSRISVANDAVGLALGYERTATQWMSNGANLSGILQTDQKLQPGAAQRMMQDWRDLKSGLQNAGKIVVLEQGAKFAATQMTAQAMEFINSRNFQIHQIADMFRIPVHMLGVSERGNDKNIEDIAQYYVNFALSSYIERWRTRLARDWGLKAAGCKVEFDTSVLTRANITARYNNYQRAISSGTLTQNECRIDDNRNPLPGGDVLLQPLNMAASGSHASGSKADGGGRPEQDSADAKI
jgi:HK97 family phage portal protein